MVLTHPLLEGWHKSCLRQCLGEYDIGVLFVPLDADAEPPVLQVLSPLMATNFKSFSELRRAAKPDWSGEVVVSVDVDAAVDALAVDISRKVNEIVDA